MESEEYLRQSEIINKESCNNFMIKSQQKQSTTMTKNKRPSLLAEEKKKEKREN